MNKKAQAAMEFLMTYGWAILVVLAAIGILASLGIFDSASRAPAKCELLPLSQGLDCMGEADALDSANSITMTVTNQQSYDMANFGITAATSCTGVSVAGGSIPAGTASVLMNLTGCTGPVAGRGYAEEFTLTFTRSDSGQTVSNKGRITGNAR